MSVKLALFVWLGSAGLMFCKECYWNRWCTYDLFATATPYERIRGDLRDQPTDNDCEVISMWSLHRHGNRNPTAEVTQDIKQLQGRITQLLSNPANRRSNNCSQDMDDLIHWTWNRTLDTSASHLTGTGYEELYRLGRRLSMRYANFIKSVDKVYFRATDEERTVTSLTAYVHGMTDETPQNFFHFIDASSERDDVIRPYEHCERYQTEVKNGQKVADELAGYDSSAEFLAIRDRVQAKLFVDYQITSTEVFTLYELCRFDRSWNAKLRSPWCAFFTDQDLLVLEYRDDVRHYYRNGYGSGINSSLGALALKDLYENFVNATKSSKKTLVSYFTHDTMMEMVYCALGLYKDPKPLQGSSRNINRLWRSTEFTAFASNFIAILSRCVESGKETHRVQFLINEKPTPLCPEKGCSWQKFRDTFQDFSKANLDFCAKSESGSSCLSGRSDTKNSIATSLIILTIVLGVL